MNQESTLRRIYRALRRLAVAAICAPLLLASLIWWLLRSRWGLGVRKRHSLRVVPAMDFSKMFDEARPSVLTEVVSQWQAFKTWTPQYLARAIGDCPVQVCITSGNVMGAVTAERYTTIPFDTLVDIVFSTPPGDRLHYMLGKGMDLLGPVRGDLVLPDGGAGRALDEYGTGLWIGHQGNLTALHHDGWHGCLAQLRGKKRVVLYSPEDSCHLGQRSPLSRTPYMTSLPEGRKTIDLEETHPQLRRAHRIEWTLEPGHLLYIPPYWWHEVESAENSISFLIRYRPRRAESAAFLVSTGNLFSAAWFFLVHRSLDLLFRR